MVKGLTSNAVMLEGVIYATDDPNHPYEYKHINANSDSIKPIPLCDLILETIRQRIPLKDGYVYSYYHERASFFIFKDEIDGYYIGLKDKKEVYRVTPKSLKYLHQLQNVYFAQYGNEMDINEQILRNSVEKATEGGLI